MLSETSMRKISTVLPYPTFSHGKVFQEELVLYTVVGDIVRSIGSGQESNLFCSELHLDRPGTTLSNREALCFAVPGRRAYL